MRHFKYEKITIFLIVVYLIIVVNASLVSADQPLLEVEVSEYYLIAGDENQIEISIANVGEESAYEVKASLTIPQTVSGISIVKESHRVFDEVEEEETKQMYPILYVASSCSPGAYSLTFGLEYYDAPPRVVDREQHVSSIQLGIIVLPRRYTFKAEVEGYRIRAGAENEIKIVLTNTGDTSVYEVDAHLSSASPNIVVLKDISSTFGVIKPKSSVYFTSTLGVSRSTPLGAYSLTLTLKYKDLNGTSYADNLVLGIFVDSVDPTDRTTIVVQDFRIVPFDIHPGDKLTLEMELKNLGADADNVQVQLTVDPQGPIASLSPTLVFVGDLGLNQTAQLIYNLDISGDAKAQLYTLQLAISYYDVYGHLNSIDETISIDVSGIYKFQMINVQPSTVTAKPDEFVLIEADLLLIGTEMARFVEVGVVTDAIFIAAAESYEYVGTVDPDSPVPFSIGFQIDPNATPGSHTLEVQVTYWDAHNRECRALMELPILVEELKEMESVEQTAYTLWDLIKILLGIRP